MRADMTDITVVMATYKQAKYLEEAMDSIASQGVPNLKLILVPSIGPIGYGHDPKTFKLLKKIAARYWEILEVEWHEGKPNLWLQRQWGLNKTRFKFEKITINGKEYHRTEDQANPYVSFFDSDDVMLPGWLEKGLKVAEEISSRGNIPIVGPSYRMVDEKLNPIQDVILPDFTMKAMMNGCIIPDFSITKTENLRIAFEAGCKVARELFAPQYSCYCTWLEMLKRFDCEVKLLPEIGFLYRQHHGGMHNRFKRSKRASRRNVETIRKIARHYFPEGVR
jgi:hypothetical protein